MEDKLIIDYKKGIRDNIEVIKYTLTLVEDGGVHVKWEGYTKARVVTSFKKVNTGEAIYYDYIDASLDGRFRKYVITLTFGHTERNVANLNTTVKAHKKINDTLSVKNLNTMTNAADGPVHLEIKTIDSDDFERIKTFLSSIKWSK